MRVLIDAGHGGKDSGAVNFITSQREDRTNYNVALLLGSMMTEIGAEAILSRRAHEETVSLSTRMAQIRSFRPDVVVSIHHNASPKHNASGGEVIAQIKKGRSAELASNLNQIWEGLGLSVRPIVYKVNNTGTADYYGILRASAEVGVPAVITEYAFIDHDEDIRLIDSYAKQKTEAESIRDALIAWWATR